MPNEQLEEELLAVNAIFGDETVVKHEERTNDSDLEHVALRFPAAECVLLLQVPSSYPGEPPRVIRPLATNLNATKGEAAQVVDLARKTLTDIFLPGEVVLYTLLDALEERWSQHQDELAAESLSLQQEQCSNPDGNRDVDQSLDEVDMTSADWVVADAVIEKKSVFIARACRINQAADVAKFLRSLKVTDKKFAKATHNIYAYRLKVKVEAGGGREVTYQDCDDDGESAAGSRLLHLLELTDCSDVLVVVSRWYGGVKLGPDRFRLINSAARESLAKGGWIAQQQLKS